MRMTCSFALALSFVFVPCLHAAEPPATPTPRAAEHAATGATQTGLAAVYSDRLNGRRTASGKRYNRTALTAAHMSLPFGTRIKVTNTHNGKSVELVVTDRGPKQAGRVLDISQAAAKALGISRRGMAEVSVDVIAGAAHAAR